MCTIVPIPLPDLVQCVKSFTDDDLNELIKNLDTLSGRPDDENWPFLSLYATAAKLELYLRDVGEPALVKRDELPQNVVRPEWSLDPVIQREHRKLLMADNPEHYNHCLVRGPTGQLMSWLEESEMKW